MSKIGTADIKGIMLGSTEIVKAYLGTDVVFQNNVPLPYDAEIEYLESTGTQYIDTGIIWDSTVVVECEVRSDCSDGGAIFGIMQDGTVRRWTVGDTPAPRIYAYFNTVTNKYLSFAANTLHTIRADKRYLTLDGSTLDSKAANFTTSKQISIYIYARHKVNINGTDTVDLSRDVLAFAWFKIWKNNELARDLIPVRVGTTGYMYDKVSKQLFGNSGTGNFILGADKN